MFISYQINKGKKNPVRLLNKGRVWLCSGLKFSWNSTSVAQIFSF